MVAKLAEAEQLKRSFLMSVSHELRTPLTAIRGHVEALREGVVSEPEQVSVSLDIVAAETDRLERLVGDVLDLAKLQAHRFTVRHEEVDLERVLDHAYGAFAEEARRREIDYRLSGVEAAPVIVSDGDRVLQVITNLLSNAFRWTPDGGRIELQLAQANGRVAVDVLDTGPGVPPSQRARIFEAFVSQDADGTGLGLPIARELAVALGGGIELRSDVETGSRFRLVLPVLPTTDALGRGGALEDGGLAAPARPRARAPRPPARRGRPRGARVARPRLASRSSRARRGAQGRRREHDARRAGRPRVARGA